MFIVDFFKNNPLALAILGGGTSTAIIGYFLNSIKWIPNTIISAVLAHITTRVQLTENVHFHSESDVDKIRELETYIRSFKHRVIDNSLNLDSGGAYTKLPQGVYYIFKTLMSDRVIITISVSSIENKGGGYKALIHRYDVHIIGTTKRRNKFVDKLNTLFENKKSKDNDELVHNKIIMACPDTNWSYLAALNKRDLSTVYMDEKIKEEIVTHIDNFINNRAVYDKYKITYKTGLILHGEPGTGKTSLVRALASHINGILVNVDSNTTMDKVRDLIISVRNDNCRNNTGISYQVLDDAIKIETAPIIILFEELDKFFMNSSNKRDKKGSAPSDDDNISVTVSSEQESPKEDGDEKIASAITSGLDNNTLDEMLQFFDGIKSPENVIFIATTNYLERLDPALTRPGRFDLCVEMKRLTVSRACDMIKDMLPHKSVMDYQEYIKEDGTVNSSELFTKLISDKIKEEVFNNKEEINERS